MSFETFRCSAGTVTYFINKLDGCCGIGVLSNPTFLPPWKSDPNDPAYRGINRSPKQIEKIMALREQQRRALYTAFHNYIVGPGYKPTDLQRAKILMTGFKGHSVYEFCTHNKWDSTMSFKNHLTGRWLYVFHYARTVRVKRKKK